MELHFLIQIVAVPFDNIEHMRCDDLVDARPLEALSTPNGKNDFKCKGLGSLGIPRKTYFYLLLGIFGVFLIKY